MPDATLTESIETLRQALAAVTTLLGEPATDGQTSSRHGLPIIQATFRAPDYTLCPDRVRCTRSPVLARHLTFRPRTQYQTQQQLRAEQATPAWRERYAHRAGIEGTIAQATRRSDLHQARYRGLAKTHLQHVLTALALNLVRVDAWLSGIPPRRHLGLARDSAPSGVITCVNSPAESKSGEPDTTIPDSTLLRAAGTRFGVPAGSRSAWWPSVSGCRPFLGRPVRVLGQRPASSVQCERPVSTHAMSTRPMSGVRCVNLPRFPGRFLFAWVADAGCHAQVRLVLHRAQVAK